MKSKYDVVIVGGGPGGLSAALSASRAGAEVLLLETHRKIGQPVSCAEGISCAGLTQVLEPNEEWISSRVSGAKLFSQNGKSMFIDHPNAGYILNRSKFEPYIAKMAEDAGTEIAKGWRAEKPVYEDGRFVRIDALSDGERKSIEFKILVAADGIESTIARQAGLVKPLLPSRVASCAQYRVEGISIEPEIPEFHFNFDIAPGGYIWVFPKGPDSANVGLGLIPTMAKHLNPFEQLDRFMIRRFDQFKISQKMMGIVPLFEGRHTMLKDNLMVVGDAARLIDSLTGAGIATALYSGKLAGELAAESVQNGNRAAILKEYPKRFMAIFGRRLRMYSLAHQIFRRLKPEELDFVVGFAEEIFAGKKTYAIDSVDVIRKILTRMPGLIKLAP
ncbi:MAG: NAD(P)/FAD-dependent oxidoreductase [Candidatus Zixiibacteriota bacterium]